jgi:hypothetical protein
VKKSGLHGFISLFEIPKLPRKASAIMPTAPLDFCEAFTMMKQLFAEMHGGKNAVSRQIETTGQI